jgi:hypothetical protein
VSLADRLAIASPKVSALSVEATEFPDLARRFMVQGVPRTVVNRGGAFVGALPEQRFVEAVLELAGVNGARAAGQEGLQSPSASTIDPGGEPNHTDL